MKRDIDLARQLLLDIEAHGANCALSSLRSNVAQGADERVRYHLRLLIDAGLVKELDRTNSGVPCVRLTNAGHELVELSRNDAQWHDAKCCAADATGGMSLTVIRAILTKWSVDAATRRRHTPYVHRVERPRRPYGYYLEREPYFEEDHVGMIRPRPEYRERTDVRENYNLKDRFNWRDAYDREVYSHRYKEVHDLDDADLGVSLPVYIV